MTLTHHASAAQCLADRLGQTSDGRAVLASYRKLIADSEARLYVRAIGQPFSGWTDGQVAALAKVDAFITSGQVRTALIPVGARPGRDVDREGNRAKLRRGLPPEFSAEVEDALNHFGDGSLAWTDTPMPWTRGEGAEPSAPLSTWCTGAPLEIGHTDASRSLLHLLESGSLARWPYGSEDVWLFWFDRFDDWTAWRAAPAERIA